MPSRKRLNSKGNKGRPAARGFCRCQFLFTSRKNYQHGGGNLYDRFVANELAKENKASLSFNGAGRLVSMAKWPAVRFLSSRLTTIQSPSVLALYANTFRRFCFFVSSGFLT